MPPRGPKAKDAGGGGGGGGGDGEAGVGEGWRCFRKASAFRVCRESL